MEVMQDMGMTDSQYKSMRRRDKKELERILEVKTAEEKDKLIKEMLEIIQQDLEDQKNAETCHSAIIVKRETE